MPDEPIPAEADNTKKAHIEAHMHVPLEISVELGRIQLPLHVIARMNRVMLI